MIRARERSGCMVMAAAFLVLAGILIALGLFHAVMKIFT